MKSILIKNAEVKDVNKKKLMQVANSMISTQEFCIESHFAALITKDQCKNKTHFKDLRFWYAYVKRSFLIIAHCVICTAAGKPGTPESRITVNSTQYFQTIDGFGVNFAGPYFREEQKTMFDKLIDDLGVTLFRVSPYLVYTDWEETNDNSDPEVMNWEYYNERYSTPIFEPSWKIIRYLNKRGIKPVIALWGPVPSWMLDNKSSPPDHAVCNLVSQIAPLKPSMYPEFAEEVVSMLMYARFKEHLEFSIFSPFNETDCYPPEGPRIDPAEAPKVLEAVVKRLRKEGMGDVRLAAADQALIQNNYITPILENADVMKQVSVFTFHTYSDNSVGPQVDRVKASPYNSIPVWLTEYGDLNDLDRSDENDWKSYCLNSSRRALQALNEGANGLFYFNAYDDYEECSRRMTYYGLFHSVDHNYYPKKRYYAVRQLYHFVRPGSQRLGTSGEGLGLSFSAFKNPDSTLVIVGVKEGGANHIKIELQGSSLLTENLDLYITTRSANCQKQKPIQFHNGVAELDLPDEAVFTLVGPANTKKKIP